MKCLAGLLLVALSTSLHAQPRVARRARFDFRGAHLGDTLAIPLQPGCSYAETPGVVRCMEPSLAIGGEDVSLSSQYIKGVRFEMILLFSPSSFDRLAALFSAQYGPAASKQRRKYRTVGGMEDANLIDTWRFSDGDFVVSKYGSSIDGGYAIIADTKLSRLAELRADEQTRAAAKHDLSAPESKFKPRRSP